MATCKGRCTKFKWTIYDVTFYYESEKCYEISLKIFFAQKCSEKVFKHFDMILDF